MSSDSLCPLRGVGLSHQFLAYSLSRNVTLSGREGGQHYVYRVDFNVCKSLTSATCSASRLSRQSTFNVYCLGFYKSLTFVFVLVSYVYLRYKLKNTIQIHFSNKELSYYIIRSGNTFVTLDEIADRSDTGQYRS